MSWEVRIMPLKTSSSKGGFSAALLRSDLTRFWPLWAAYTTVWLLAMPAAQFLLLFRRSSMWGLEDMDWRRLEAVDAILLPYEQVKAPGGVMICRQAEGKAGLYQIENWQELLFNGVFDTLFAQADYALPEEKEPAPAKS